MYKLEETCAFWQLSQALYLVVVRLVPDVLSGYVKLERPMEFVKLLGLLKGTLEVGGTWC